MNYRKINGSYNYVNVGSWENNKLSLRLHEIEWPGPRLAEGKYPVSICSLDCDPGYRKDMIDDEQCCWVCML